MTPITDHLAIMDMIVRGMFGNPNTMPQLLREWPQVRPALTAAIEEIKRLRRVAEAADIAVAYYGNRKFDEKWAALREAIKNNYVVPD